MDQLKRIRVRQSQAIKEQEGRGASVFLSRSTSARSSCAQKS